MMRADAKYQPLSAKLVSFLQSRHSRNTDTGRDGDVDAIIRLLRGGEGKGCLRVYLALHLECSVDEHMQVPSYEVNVLKIHAGAKSVFADRLFDCSDTTLPLVKVKLGHSSSDGRPLSHLLIREIAQKGFTFLGEQYHFLAFKDLGTEFAFFFPQSYRGSPSQQYYSNSFSLWQSIGDFAQLSHVPAVGLRLGLLVSGACAGLEREVGIRIRMLDDVFVAGNDEEVATGKSGKHRSRQ